MSKQEQARELAQAFSRGEIDRRDFIRQAAGLGLSLASLGALLSACGNKEQKAPDNQAGTGLEKELVIYNWSDYIAEDTVKNFEKEFGVKVTYGTYETNEDLLAKLQPGASGYDLVCPSGYAGQVMITQGLAKKLDTAQLPNLVNIAPQFRKTAFDPTDEYTVPWQWGRTGIAYRKDLVKAPPDSWGIFLSNEYGGKMTQMDDMRDVLGAWLKFRGKSLNSVNPEELEAAKKDALDAKKYLQQYISAPVKNSLISGDVVIAQLWDGDTLQAQAEKAEIEWILPKEGGSIWLDSMMIPKDAPHPKAAHAFLNYILRPDVGASISNATGYGSPNKAAQEKIEKAVPFPNEDQMKLLEFQKDLGKETALWDKIWTEIKAG